MRRVYVFLLRSVSPLTDGYPGLYPCFFAGLHALVPRVLKSCVTDTPTVLEPRTAATTTTALPRFRDGGAFAARGPDGRRLRDWWCFYVGTGQRNKEAKRYNSR